MSIRFTGISFTVLRSNAVSPLICGKQHQPPIVNYMLGGSHRQVTGRE